MEEMTIHVGDLICKVLLKWRRILIWMIAFAVIVTGLFYVKNSRAAKASEESPATTVEKAREALTEYEILETENYVVTYQNYQKQYLQIQQYNANSIRMKLNPNEVSAVEMKFYIENDYQAEYPVIEAHDNTSEITLALTAAAINDAMFEKLAEEWGEEVTPVNLRELVTPSASSLAEGILNVTVLGENREQCMRIANAVRDGILSSADSLKETFGEFEVTCVSQVYQKITSSALLAEQQNQVSNLNVLTQGFKNILNALNDNEKTYYYALLNERQSKEELEAMTEELGLESAALESQNTAAAKVPIVRKMYIFIGLFAGAFLAVIWYLVAYLFSAKLRTREDIGEVSGVTNLGCVSADRKKGLGGKIDSLFYGILYGRKKKSSEAEQIRLICAAAAIAAKKQELTEIFVTGSCDDADACRIREAICSQLKEKGISAACGNSVLYDADALEALVKADSVVIVEKIGKSAYREIFREIDICKNNHISVIGNVILE